ncbi:MAG: hypothetical protein QM627_07040 [Luteolibacter sp.]
MAVPTASPLELTLQALVLEVRDLLHLHADAPDAESLREAFRTLYAASLLKEEGRSVRARIVIAPPAAFPLTEGPPDGEHVLRFATSHPFSPNEIKRLSPAAGFFHSAIAIWPEGNRGIRIWGLLNTGQRWMNLVAGGRKAPGNELPFPLIHLRDPGWLLFYHNYQLLAEWRGTEFHDANLDVFQSRIFHERFRAQRRKMVESISGCCLPENLSLDAYSELSHLITQQFIKRLISLVRANGHGGTLVLMPGAADDEENVSRWIDCKYILESDAAGMRFRLLLEAILHRVGQLCPPETSSAEAWEIFRNSYDPELDRLEEAFFELARFYSDLTQVDGALVVDQRLRVIGFGGEIRVDRNVILVNQAHDLEATRLSDWNMLNDGTRHRSLYRLCSVDPDVIGFVISQDSQVRLIANHNDTVIFWMHTMV